MHFGPVGVWRIGRGVQGAAEGGQIRKRSAGEAEHAGVGEPDQILPAQKPVIAAGAREESEFWAAAEKLVGGAAYAEIGKVVCRVLAGGEIAPAFYERVSISWM